MTKENSLGVVDLQKADRRLDYLYRLSVKGLVRNESGEVHVVKETGRDWWDLPGGGMDHGEDIAATIAREMKEEVDLTGAFTFEIICVDEPDYLEVHDLWQVRLIFEIQPTNMDFSPGIDADAVKFINPKLFEDSSSKVERKIFQYANIDN